MTAKTIEVPYGTRCPINTNVYISSPKCQKCTRYISHEIVNDDHGRSDSIIIACQVINCDYTKK